jgi:hypothetical protein
MTAENILALAGVLVTLIAGFTALFVQLFGASKTSFSQLQVAFDKLKKINDELRADNVALKSDNSTLQKENIKLAGMNDELRITNSSMAARYEKKYIQQAAKIRLLEQEIRQLKVSLQRALEMSKPKEGA